MLPQWPVKELQCSSAARYATIIARTMSDWSPSSWQSRDALQQPQYPDERALCEAVAQLAKLPPLVSSWEIESLKSQLADAQEGSRFLLQGGDCAESFDDCESSAIADKLKILLQMSLVLVHGTKKRVIRVGRFAGQYAKPRSEDTETVGEITLPTYRGDTINRIEFTPEARTPDPTLMLRGYERAALTLNFIRALIDGGFADLHHPEYWDLDFVKHSPQAAEYQKMVEAIGQSLRFMETLSGVQIGQLSRVDFYTSHEALHLLYEQAQTRRVPHREGWYNLATHFPWLGVRTSDPIGAHVEYLRGINNPIAIKVGGLAPNSRVAEAPGSHDSRLLADHVLTLLEALNPNNEPGRITLITRFGAHHIGRTLPPLIEAVARSRRPVLWVCDPMHGNTERTATGVKTRKFEHILAELEQCFEIHKQKGTYLGGVHFELTGDNVTECTGGARGLSEDDLTRAYRTQVDPRLNYEQALEMAMIIARRVG